MYKDENANAKEEVNNAYSELVTAFLNLKINSNESLLEELINQAEELNSTNYTKATFDGLTKTKTNKAKVVFENQMLHKLEMEAMLKATLEKSQLPDYKR